jgi:hypothetical protein
VRDLFGPVLVDDVVVGHRERVRVAEVDLLLAGPGFALGGLHADPRRLHPVADLPHEGLVVGRGEDVVVEDVGDGGRQVQVVLRVRLRVGLLQEVELELGAEHRHVAELACALDLPLQHLAGRGRHGSAVVPGHVAEDERGRLEPGNSPERGQIGAKTEVAVTLLPACDAVAGHRVHLHLEGEQVVTALHAVLGHVLLQEELRMQAFAEEASLHVGERDDDRVDRAALHLVTQLVQREHGCESYHGGLVTRSANS